ncbi:uncharacterized protein LOC119665867 [Teleopsis dalmanni]|uniref:uncharacterized protein LOC119665867 n=1 Tax=Teleopsis dalmanni TaxID=139649 RepID=UPI0018CCB2FE|nr:uncharacterized protein LOC119665867 [Teleopsis dalmanni]
MNESELRIRLSLIETNFSQLRDIQTEIEQGNEEPSQEFKRIYFEDLYCDIKAIIVSEHSKRKEQCSVLDTSGGFSVTLPGNQHRSCNLPKLKLPHFSGKYTEWMSWFNTFVTLVDSDVELDELSKFVHLRSCLDAVPLSTIEGLELSASNYKRALGLLKNRFENRSIIFQAHVRELTELPRMDHGSSDNLRLLVDRVNTQLEALKSLGNEKDILDVIIYNSIRSKLDPSTLSKWESQWDCTTLPSWALLSKFLVNQHAMLANRELTRNVGDRIQKKPNNKQGSSVLIASFNSDSKIRCYSCEGKHSLYQCQNFLKLSPLQRYYEAKKYSLCLICLEKRHSIKECGSSRCQTCSEYHALDHLEILNNAEEIAKIKYFMPHHAVVRPESITTKLRVVFDTSCKTSNGRSLNDMLLVGPTLQPELFEILIHFRCYRFALTADISKMYRQILVDDEGINYQGILWRDNSEYPMQVLRLKTVTYGTSSAPYLAVRCLKFLADEYRDTHKEAASMLMNNFYMDDMLGGADSVQELIAIKNEVTSLLSLGNFELHKWRSNCEELSATMNSPLLIKTDDCSKTLGIYWDSKSDFWKFTYDITKTESISKRRVLSELAQLFDPLGLLSPIIIIGKIFMQELWLRNIHWNESLPQDLHTRWQKYRQELRSISKCTFPRSVVSLNSVSSIQLHGFFDASERAFGAAIYVRSIDAPVHATSLPRLELQGALLLAELMCRIQKCIAHKIQAVHYWTDSTIVLNWLLSYSKRWVTFVANRVDKIQELSVPESWHKIESKLNPADIISRGMYPSELKDCNLWYKGPAFLSLDKENWLQYNWKIVNEAIPEERKQILSLFCKPSHNLEDLVSRCKFINEFGKLQRVFSYIFRWVQRVRIKKRNSGTDVETLTVSELRGGLHYMVFNVQNVCLGDVINCIRSNQSIKSSNIQGLSPFIGTKGPAPIIRVGGRLKNASLPFPVEHPILMPNNHGCVRALIKYLHRINYHAGVQALCAFVRQRYWVINCRYLARKVVRSCLDCFRQHPTTSTQLMGSLPSYRVDAGVTPFMHTGMDFAGPIKIHFNIRGKRPDKAHLCLFVCFSTKAVHIEVVSDLSSNAFIACLKRFFARRGLSAYLMCDNATNFVGASRELNELAEEFFKTSTRNRITNECADRGVNFHFIPPRSPHFGGLWESAVKVV